MSDFIINTAQWKRWVLPDNEHLYDSYLYGDTFTIKIIHRLSNRTVQTHSIVIDKEGQYKKLLELSQELANRKYGRKYAREERWSGNLGSSLGKV